MWAHLNVMSSSIKAGRKIWNTFVGSLFFLLMATRKPFTVSVMCVFFFTLASSLFDWKNLKCHFVCEREKKQSKSEKAREWEWAAEVWNICCTTHYKETNCSGYSLTYTKAYAHICPGTPATCTSFSVGLVLLLAASWHTHTHYARAMRTKSFFFFFFSENQLHKRVNLEMGKLSHGFCFLRSRFSFCVLTLVLIRFLFLRLYFW